MKNLILIMNAIVLMLTLSIIILPNLWMISVVGGEEGLKGIAFPVIWTIYVISVFVTAGFTFSWLVKSGQ
ncbi:MAG: Unknown protein [uncultured Sulfurovum sp.]|uniref:Uncharacterized protein n=1 Tax=uncultured Sulfurovum sp. TaxID=269237 RepID=A0A6S6TYC8_9BACT|nr:MAG: Unknown protein [uncultured Sulfurovum sp.]